MRSCYFGNGVTWSYTGFEAHCSFSFFTAAIADTTDRIATKIRQNQKWFLAIWTLNYCKELFISLLKQHTS